MEKLTVKDVIKQAANRGIELTYCPLKGFYMSEKQTYVKQITMRVRFACTIAQAVKRLTEGEKI